MKPATAPGTAPRTTFAARGSTPAASSDHKDHDGPRRFALDIRRRETTTAAQDRYLSWRVWRVARYRRPRLGGVLSVVGGHALDQQARRPVRHAGQHPV